MNKENKGILYYLIGDYGSAAIAWLLFLLYRKQELKSLGVENFSELMNKNDWLNTLLIIPSLWLLLHYLSGSYFNLYRKSRLIEIYRTFITSLIGCILLFFKPVLNDKVPDYNYYYKAFFIYLLLQWLLTSLFRHLVLNNAKRNIRKRAFSFTTLIIGGNGVAESIYKEIIGEHKNTLNNFIGYVSTSLDNQPTMQKYMPCLGTVSEIVQLVEQHKVDEVVIGIDTHEHELLQDILSKLSHTDAVVKISPDMYDIIAGSVRTSNVWGAVMIEIYPELMPDWQRVLKRMIDIVVSIVVMILLLPLYLFAMLRVKLSSPGPIFYSQERIGLHGKPFKIYKFRSMLQNAEAYGPALSSETDTRITKWGKVMRKWRIDELPQFVNVLKGEMSLVGPRPERQFFIDQIITTHPHYKFLHRVKPGLSSWGMVKYGYASSIHQMKERMRYDLLYIKNCSLALDTKIMIYTILVILQGRGK
jgi:polysaccharide biosynthesis protein PslA